MRVQLRFVLTCALANTLLFASAAGAADPLGQTGLPDLDVRAGKIAPTAAQRSAVRALHAQVAWNEFGTPSSLVDTRGSLGAAAGSSAPDAARAFIGAHRRLFRLSSTRGLEAVADNKLASIEARTVTLRQTPGGVGAAGGGMVTVGLAKAGAGWKVVSVSSSLSGDERLAGTARMNLAQGWQRAAASVGRSRSVAQVARVRGRHAGVAKGWTGLRVAGMRTVQQARKVAFPTVKRGYLPAYEALVVDSSSPVPSAYHVVVDARTGKTLQRENLVDSDGATDAAAAANTVSFSGELPAVDGGCDTPKGPITVPASGARVVIAFADAAVPQQDIVLRLLQGTTIVSTGDTGTTPERLRFEPRGGVAPGDYFAQVCEFADGKAPVEPRTYTGTLDLDLTPSYLARWRTFPANPPLATLDADPWNNPSTDTRQNWCWQAPNNPADCDKVIGNLASRSPWDFNPQTNAPTNTTFGNNARSAESWTNAARPGANQFMPTSPTRDYTFPWTNAWANADCNPGDPYGSAFVVGQSFDVSAATTNLFVMHNRMHDFAYNLGFTEQNFNAQLSNFGLTDPSRENDPVLGDVQAGATLPPPGVYGAARDNANMTTFPDGTPSVTNMYLWQPIAGAFYAPCVDGDYDAGVIGHEYTHMIENRTIGKGSRRSGFQAGAMGEAVGDLFAEEYLHESGFLPTDGENDFAEGPYVTGNKQRGIRNYAMNFPRTGALPQPGQQTLVDPLNFSDVGYDLTGPEVHADGEIWIAINFDIRQALIDKYNAQFPATDQQLQEQCESGALPVTQCPGNRRWIQILFDAFLLMPTAPSMVDARNAMLAADQARFGGADQAELWAAFARRGLGRFASQTNTSGRVNGVESDTDPLPDFEAPGQNNARVNFTATSTVAGGPAVKARIYVGHYEARISPIADTDPATNAPSTASANNLDSTAVFAPGTYEFIATAPGYGAVRFRRTFPAGGNVTVAIRFAPNLASASQGATATGDATPVTSPTSVPAGAVIQTSGQVLHNLIDDTEDTDWQAAADQQADGSFGVDGKQVTIDLAGTRPQTIRHVQVSAMLGPVFDPNAQPRPADLTQNRFTAVRQFEIWTCNDRFADCSTDAGYQRALQSAADAFPANAPRPVAPHLLLRNFAFSPVRATHVRVVVRSTQCTAGPDFQGEQDADPFNATDCNSAGPAATRFARLAEVQVFGGTSSAR